MAEIDPLGHRTACHYDDWGRLTNITDPVGATTTYVWSTSGQPLALTGPAGIT